MRLGQRPGWGYDLDRQELARSFFSYNCGAHYELHPRARFIANPDCAVHIPLELQGRIQPGEYYTWEATAAPARAGQA